MLTSFLAFMVFFTLLNRPMNSLGRQHSQTPLPRKFSAARASQMTRGGNQQSIQESDFVQFDDLKLPGINLKNSLPRKKQAIETIRLPENSNLKLAIIPGIGDRQPHDDILTLFEAQLMAQSGLNFIERIKIHDILDELSLSSSGLINTTEAAQMGQLVGADILTFIEKIPNSHPATYRIRFVETKSGVTLNSVIESQESVIADLTTTLLALKTTLAQSTIAPNSRQYIGILGFHNVEPGNTLDATAEALKMLLARDLVASQKVIILDREHLNHLNDERYLTGYDVDLRKATYLIEGGLQYTSQKKEIKIQLLFKNFDGKQSAPIILKVPADDPFKMRQALLNSIFDYLETRPPMMPFFDETVEADLFVSRVPMLLASGDFDEAVRHAEVAFTLNPTQTNRYWVARAWHALAWELIRPGTEFSAGNTRVIKVMATRLDGRRPLPNEKPPCTTVEYIKGNTNQICRDFWKDRITLPPPEPIVKKISYQRKNTRGLMAWIRAYEMIYALSRTHIEEYESGLITDPELPIASLNLPPLDIYFRHLNQHEKIMYARFLKIREDVFRLHRNFYSTHLNTKINQPKKNLQRLNQWSTGFFSKQKQTSEFTGAWQDDVNRVRTKYENRGEQLAKGLYELFSAHFDEEYFSTLTYHEDPFMQLLGHHFLMQKRPEEHAELLLQIFLTHFPYDHPYRHFKDQNFIPSLVTPAVQKLAIMNRDQVIKNFAPVIEGILKAKDLKQLLAWRHSFWPLANCLSLSGNKRKALELINAAIKIHDSKFLHKHSNAAKTFRAQLDLRLVELGAKRTPDKKFAKYFDYSDMPYYISLDPALEAPRPGRPKIDTSQFKNAKGDAFSKGVTRSFDKYGNPIYTSYRSDELKQAQLPYASDYTFVEWPMNIRQQRSNRMTTNRSEPLQPHQILIDGTDIYRIEEKKSGSNIQISIYHFDLEINSIFLLGRFFIPQSDVIRRSRNDHFVNALAASPDHVYVGTQKGLVMVDKSGGERSTNLDTLTSSTSRTSQYEPYYLSTTERQRHTPKTVGKLTFVSQEYNFPQDNVIALIYHAGKLYAGIGPLQSGPTGLVGSSGFIEFDPSTGTHETIVSSRSLNKKNPLETGENFKVSMIVADHKQNYLWLAINEHPKFQGIWSFDPHRKRLEQIIKEKERILGVKTVDDGIMYALYQSGIVHYDSTQRKKKWLMGFTVSAFAGPRAPRAPKGIWGDPQFGHPKAYLWPFVVHKNQMMTLSWQYPGIMLLDSKKNSSTLKQGLNNDGIQYIFQNPNGIFILTNTNRIYRLQKRQ